MPVDVSALAQIRSGFELLKETVELVTRLSFICISNSAQEHERPKTLNHIRVYFIFQNRGPTFSPSTSPARDVEKV